MQRKHLKLAVGLGVVCLLTGLIALLGSRTISTDDESTTLRSIAHWLLYIGGIFVLVPIFSLLKHSTRSRERKRRLARDRCPRCEFPLTHPGATICPECGEDWTTEELRS